MPQLELGAFIKMKLKMKQNQRKSATFQNATIHLFRILTFSGIIRLTKGYTPGITSAPISQSIVKSYNGFFPNFGADKSFNKKQPYVFLQKVSAADCKSDLQTTTALEWSCFHKAQSSPINQERHQSLIHHFEHYSILGA